MYAVSLSLWDYSQGSVAATQKQQTDTFNIPPRLLGHCWETPHRIWIKQEVGLNLRDDNLRLFISRTYFELFELADGLKCNRLCKNSGMKIAFVS